MKLSSLLAENRLNISPPRELPNMPQLGLVPHFIVGDEAFPLEPFLMRPYPGKQLDNRKLLYNYRHSRARRISENAFGILDSKFRIYHRKLDLCPKNVDKVVLATCVLHNFIRKTAGYVQPSQDTVEELNTARGLGYVEKTGYHSGKDGVKVREALTEYVNSVSGAISWQEQVCFGQAR